MKNKDPKTTMTTVPKEKTLKKYLVALGKMHKNLTMKKDRKGYVAKKTLLYGPSLAQSSHNECCIVNGTLLKLIIDP